jgi:RNA polymerase sigma-70 factor (ECF subfamily)
VRWAGRPAGASPIATSPTTEARPDATDDEAVIASVLDGRRDAFRVLVDRESASVVRACFRILGSLDEAEDAAQEAFVTAFRSLSTWRGDGPFGAWLTRIAVRIALRMAASRRTVQWTEPAEPGRDPGRVLETVHGTADAVDPSMLAVRREQQADVRRAIAGLDEPYREVVALRFFGELSLADIALQTDRPIGTVKTHLHRGLARLRGALETEGNGS